MGERAVRDTLNSGRWGQAGHVAYDAASRWLKDVEFVRLAADSARRDAREEETLAIARSSRSIAIAAIISATIGIISQIIFR